MTPLERLLARRPLRTLNDSPVARAEQMHIERNQLAGRRLRLSRLMLLALALSMAVPVAEVLRDPIAAITRQSPLDVETLLRLAAEFTTLVIAAILFTHNLMISGLASRLTSSTVAREKRGRTWEALILTAQPARRLVIDKWWGVMQVIWARHRAAILLRAALAAWLLILFNLRTLTSPPPLLPAALAIGFITLIPLINGAFTGALGMISSALAGSETSAARFNGLIGAASVLLLIGFGCCGAPFLFNGVDAALPLIAAALIFTIIDGGLTALLVLILSPDDPNQAVLYLGGVALWTLFFCLLTGAALWAAARLLRMQGASGAAAKSR
ncbi:MAG: hypothetical protein JNL42_22395 [Anaerolineae bacterium]|nr:hypothetical protein [Anaerolineae bacterium]